VRLRRLHTVPWCLGLFGLSRSARAAANVESTIVDLHGGRLLSDGVRGFLSTPMGPVRLRTRWSAQASEHRPGKKAEAGENSQDERSAATDAKIWGRKPAAQKKKKKKKKTQSYLNIRSLSLSLSLSLSQPCARERGKRAALCVCRYISPILPPTRSGGDRPHPRAPPGRVERA